MSFSEACDEQRSTITKSTIGNICFKMKLRLPSRRDSIFCSIGIALGLVALLMTNLVVGEFMEPRLKACQRSDIDAKDFADATGYHSYSEFAGFGMMNSFVCIITQFFFDLATSGIGGTFIGFEIFVTAIPFGILLALEAGRPDAKGLIRYPMILIMLGQIIGISVVIPLLWIPSFVLGKGTGPVPQKRILLSAVPALVPVILAILTFRLDPNTWLWTTCAGVLGGPGLVLAYIPLWTSGGSEPSPKSCELSTLSYLAMAAICTLLWLWLLLVMLTPAVGVGPVAIYKTVWSEASAPTKFMLIDMTVLWLSGVLIIAYQKAIAALEAVGLSCVLGPGAGLALVLAGLQVKDGEGTPSLLKGTRKEARATSRKDD